MILQRAIFHAKFGKAAEVIAFFKSSTSMLTGEQMAALQPRMLSDLSGRFDTVILESTHESMAAYEQFRQAIFAGQADSGEPSPLVDLVESGRNEFYTIEM